jgi:hypothetical protein
MGSGSVGDVGRPSEAGPEQLGDIALPGDPGSGQLGDTDRPGEARPEQAGDTDRPGEARPEQAAGAAGRDDVRAPLFGRVGRALLLLFPQAPAAPRRSRPARLAIALATPAAVAGGAWLMLARQPGRPAQGSLVAEDHNVFLPQALAHPWGSLFRAYNGYEEFVPRLIADVVAKLPFRDAAVGFAVSGALIASCCAVFVFYACSGHVRTPALRVLLAASVVLLPTGLASIANTGVNSIWYVLFAAFWALVWRPRSPGGAAAAAVVCFAAASSNALAALYLPLVAARVIALPRIREQAATVGLIAGGALQLPAVLTVSRHTQGTSLDHALAFYGHLVILPAVAGHHLAARLWDGVGLTAATLIAAAVVAAAAVWACLRAGPRARAFVLAALLLGLILTLVPVFVHGHVANIPLSRTALYAPGSRYAQTPIMLIDSALIVAVDAYLRRGGIRFERVAHAMAAVLLVAVLGILWVNDFRYANARATSPSWSHTVARVERSCQQNPQRPVYVLHETLSCDRLVGVSGPDPDKLPTADRDPGGQRR